MPFTSLLLRWFRRHRRALPWRAEPRDPYRVWLAEVMLQQTQVATVIPYYERWLERFPSVAELAAAPLDDVLKRWEGLGYYARARNLHRAARAVMETWGGRVPDTVEELRTLPGVGRYTAAAVASLAFNRDAPLVDGNVKRVIGRIYAGDPRAGTEAGIWEIATTLLPPGRSGEFNEALMDLGATVCAPRAPRCPVCPVRGLCAAFASGTPEAFPPKVRKATIPHRHIGTAVVEDRRGRLLLAQRRQTGLLGGLWEFPSTDFASTLAGRDREAYAPQIAGMIEDVTGLRVRVAAADIVGEFRHAFTHFRITRHVAHVRVQTASRTGSPRPRTSRYQALGWFTPLEADRLALARSDRSILRACVGGALDRQP